MNKEDSVVSMKTEVLILKICMNSADIGESLVAQEEYEVLVDRFFIEHQAIAPLESRLNAIEDVDYFVSLLDAAIRSYRREELDAGGS
jgi:hypothetical protein